VAPLCRSFVLLSCCVVILAVPVSVSAQFQLQPGDIIVANQGDGAVIKIDPSTYQQVVLAPAGSILAPRGLAVTPGGDVLVSDMYFADRSRVLKIDHLTGALTVLTEGILLKRSWGILADCDDRVVVAAMDGRSATSVFGPDAIVRVHPDGSQSYLSVGGMLSDPKGLAYDAAGRIFVADNSAFNPTNATDRVLRVDPATGAQQSVSNGQFFADPSGITITRLGEIYVTDLSFEQGGVYRVDAATGVQTRVAWRLAPGSLVNNAVGIAGTLDGSLIVADSFPGALIRLDPATGAQTLVPNPNGLLNRPIAVTIVGGSYGPPCDVTPPDIGARVSPEPNGALWNNTDVIVTLTATDDSSVATIQYSASGATTIQNTEAAGGTVSVPVAAEGRTTLTYTATDHAGNTSELQTLIVSIDKTAPGVTATRSPAVAEGAWTNSDVTVQFSSTDGGSGLDGPATVSTTVSTEGAGQSVSADFSDVAGNHASLVVGGINIDKTAPLISCGVSPEMLWPANHKNVPVTATVVATDTVSSATFTLEDVSSNEDLAGSVDISGFVVGTADTTGLLRAERAGNGSGRVYTMLFRATDLAGNSTVCSPSVLVPRSRQ
jgi:streptogramin lyase